jgi:hypothetical protein
MVHTGVDYGSNIDLDPVDGRLRILRGQATSIPTMVLGQFDFP